LSRRRHACTALGSAILEHRGHSGIHRGLPEGYRIRPRFHHFAYVVGDLEDFKNAGATAIAGSVTAFASFRFMHTVTYLQPKHGVTWLRGNRLGRNFSLDLAAYTEDADQ